MHSCWRQKGSAGMRSWWRRRLVGLVSVNRLSPHLPRATGAEVKHPCVLGKSGSDNQGFPHYLEPSPHAIKRKTGSVVPVMGARMVSLLSCMRERQERSTLSDPAALRDWMPASSGKKSQQRRCGRLGVFQADGMAARVQHLHLRPVNPRHQLLGGGDREEDVLGTHQRNQSGPRSVRTWRCSA
jgi:hypothetical protein